jgi:integrase
MPPNKNTWRNRFDAARAFAAASRLLGHTEQQITKKVYIHVGATSVGERIQITEKHKAKFIVVALEDWPCQFM